MPVRPSIEIERQERGYFVEFWRDHVGAQAVAPNLPLALWRVWREWRANVRDMEADALRRGK